MCFLNTSLHAAPFQNGDFEQISALWSSEGVGYDRLNDSEQDLTGWTIEILSGSTLEWISYTAAP